MEQAMMARSSGTNGPVLDLGDMKDEVIILLRDRAHTSSKEYFQERYEEIGQIGEGACGKVFKVLERDSGRYYAAKEISLKYSSDYYSPGSTMETISNEDTLKITTFIHCCREAVLQTKANHPNVVKCIKSWIQQGLNWTDSNEDISNDFAVIIDFLEAIEPRMTDEVRNALYNTEGLSFYLIMNLYDMNLLEYISKSPGEALDEETVQRGVEGILKGLEYIHDDLKYIHIDLKPKNIMVNVDWQEDDQEGRRPIDIREIAITDFGVSRPQQPYRATVCDIPSGTLPYNTAPEKKYSTKFDIWSFGLILYMMIAKRELTVHEYDDTREDLIGNMANLREESQDKRVLLNQYLSLLEGCLKGDHKERSSASELLEKLTPSDIPIV